MAVCVFFRKLEGVMIRGACPLDSSDLPPFSECTERSTKSLLPDFLGRGCGSTTGVLKTELVWEVFISVVYSEYLSDCLRPWLRRVFSHLDLYICIFCPFQLENFLSEFSLCFYRYFIVLPERHNSWLRNLSFKTVKCVVNNNHH